MATSSNTAAAPTRTRAQVWRSDLIRARQPKVHSKTAGGATQYSRRGPVTMYQNCKPKMLGRMISPAQPTQSKYKRCQRARQNTTASPASVGRPTSQIVAMSCHLNRSISSVANG